MLTISILLATLGITFGDDPDLQALDPQNPEDHATLMAMVSQSGNGNRAAKRLAEAGYMDELLAILESTTNYHTMQAIAQTRDERTIPVFESRLRREPENRYLVGSLAYVRSPKASPILKELLEMHPDREAPTDQDMAGCILNALVLNQCHDAIPLLRDRYDQCEWITADLMDGPNTEVHLFVVRAGRKSNYAITLLSLGDPTGVLWLREHIAADIDNAKPCSMPVDRLATVCWYLLSLSDEERSLRIEDESILAPLIPELVRGVSMPDCSFSSECSYVLRLLTRHNFDAHDAACLEWYEQYADRELVYTKTKDRVVRLCLDRFRENLLEAGMHNERVKWMCDYLRPPSKGYDDFLWKVESHPEWDNRVMPRIPFPKKELGLLFQAELDSRARPLNDMVYSQQFKKSNVVVQLCLYTEDAETTDLVIDCARRACEPLAEYEAWCQRLLSGEISDTR